jgi:hypothetical protein
VLPRYKILHGRTAAESRYPSCLPRVAHCLVPTRGANNVRIYAIMLHTRLIPRTNAFSFAANETKPSIAFSAESDLQEGKIEYCNPDKLIGTCVSASGYSTTYNNSDVANDYGDGSMPKLTRSDRPSHRRVDRRYTYSFTILRISSIGVSLAKYITTRQSRCGMP